MANPLKTKDGWKDIVRSVAPSLAAVLGGPLAGVAVKEIADKVLGDKDADESRVEQAILSATPELLIKLKEVDYEFKNKMVDAGIKLEELSASDRASARRREIEAKDSITPRVLAAVFVIGWFVIQWHLLTNVVPSEMREIIMRTLGTMDIALGLILAYYFGSSSGSARKNEILATSIADKDGKG